MPNITGATNYFTKAAENSVAMSLGGSIASSATTVPVNGMTNYTDGDIVAFCVDPTSTTAKQVFTGTKSGLNVINVTWTEGTNQPHTAGATVIDYVTATDWDLMQAGMLKQHTQTGTHTAITATSLTSSGAVTANGGIVVPAGQTITGQGFSPITMYNPYKFSAYRSTSQSIPATTTTPVIFDTKEYDTSSNFDVVASKFTAPIAGWYMFSSLVAMNSGASGEGYVITLLKNNATSLATDTQYSIPSTSATLSLVLSKPVQLALNDYVQITIFNSVAAVRGVLTGANQTYFSGFLVSQT